AVRAACSGSPFLTAPLRICASASRDIRIDPRAMASRLVTGLSPTSTILTRPRASTCERRFLGGIQFEATTINAEIAEIHGSASSASSALNVVQASYISD